MTVSRISITPVKSLALHHPREIELGDRGVAANRRFFFVREDGKLLAGLHHGALVRLRAEWDEAADRLSIELPDRPRVSAPVRTGERIETDFWGDRRVAGRIVDGPWAEAVSAFAGFPVRLVKAELPGGAVDVEPVTLASTASAEEVARRAGVTSVDGRRFRMLLELDGCRPHEEDGWSGRRLRVGAAVLDVLGPVPRCATITHDPATGSRDLDALKTLAGYRERRAGKHIDYGMYARVAVPGRARVGDAVALE